MVEKRQNADILWLNYRVGQFLPRISNSKNFGFKYSRCVRVKDNSWDLSWETLSVERGDWILDHGHKSGRRIIFFWGLFYKGLIQNTINSSRTFSLFSKKKVFSKIHLNFQVLIKAHFNSINGFWNAPPTMKVVKGVIQQWLHNEIQNIHAHTLITSSLCNIGIWLKYFLKEIPFNIAKLEWLGENWENVYLALLPVSSRHMLNTYWQCPKAVLPLYWGVKFFLKLKLGNLQRNKKIGSKCFHNYMHT